MAGERDGDELFEDLDKFFAPIRDVDWDEPEAQAPQAPHEEHVEVHAGEPPEELPMPAQGSSDEGDEDEDEDWYDTGVIEAVEEVPAALEPGTTQEIVVVHEPVDEGQDGEATPGDDESQGDLFSDDEWPDDEDEGSVVGEAGPTGRTIDEQETVVVRGAPSD